MPAKARRDNTFDTIAKCSYPEGITDTNRFCWTSGADVVFIEIFKGRLAADGTRIE